MLPRPTLNLETKSREVIQVMISALTLWSGAWLSLSYQFSVTRQFVNHDQAVVPLNNFVLDVAYNRFVARSPQFIMKGYGR
jgi:hypothetical protein